jgi:glycosyltransferase involved in cell wall biosynthesis
VLSFGLTERFWKAERAHLRVHGRRPPMRSRILVPLTLLSQSWLALRSAEAIVVLSAADRDHLVRHVGLPGARVSCAHTGAAPGLRELERAAHAGIRVLFLGSWIERKGTLELVAAWRRLSAERPGVRLTLAGVGEANRARTEIGDLARVDLIPAIARAALAPLLASHDIFVLPSWFEGMPLSMLDAAAAGLPCVVCAVCGNLDVFRPQDPRGDGGILIPPNDTDALYRAMRELVDDAELRSKLGNQARGRSRQFTWSRNADQTLTAFTAAVERSTARRRVKLV